MSSKQFVVSSDKVTALSMWCCANLNKQDWDFDVLTMFPLRCRFTFKDEKITTFAILNTIKENK